MNEILQLDSAPQMIADLLGISLQQVMEKITVDLHGKIVLRTPVDTGRARASWNIHEGEPDTSVPPEMEGKANAGGSSASREKKAAAIRVTGSGAVSSAPPLISGTKPVYITSSLEYVQFLEEGSSQQAPAGMVQISLIEIETELEQLIARAIQ